MKHYYITADHFGWMLVCRATYVPSLVPKMQDWRAGAK